MVCGGILSKRSCLVFVRLLENITIGQEYSEQRSVPLVIRLGAASYLLRYIIPARQLTQASGLGSANDVLCQWLKALNAFSEIRCELPAWAYDKRIDAYERYNGLCGQKFTHPRSCPEL